MKQENTNNTGNGIRIGFGFGGSVYHIMAEGKTTLCNREIDYVWPEEKTGEYEPTCQRCRKLAGLVKRETVKPTAYRHAQENGEVATRNSHRTYTHVALVDGIVISWHGSRQLADKTGCTVEAINNGSRN